MKMCFFHLMPYPHLPSDFEKQYHSVWVDPPSHLYDPKKGHQVYNDYLDELEFAEQMGFDGLCVNEHHNNAYGLMPSPNLMASAMIRRTSQAAIIVLGNSIALYNPPVRVAEEFSMLDVMSGGRFVAGFPLGSCQDTVFGYGQVPVTLREKKYQEAHDLIIKAWTCEEPFAFNGKYTQLRYVNIWPRPYQQPHPPIWVPGSGSLETWDFTLDHDYVYCYLSYSGYKVGKTVLDGFWNEVERRGKEFNPYHAGFLQLVAVSETDSQAEEYKEYIEYFFKKCLHVPGGFANAPGYRTMRSVNSGVSAQIVQSRREQLETFTWLDYINAGNVICGSPQTVREELAQAIKELRVGNLMLLLHFGDMPRDITLKNTELFAREVMPYVRDIYSEYDTRWWPRTMMTPERAAG